MTVAPEVHERIEATMDYDPSPELEKIKAEAPETNAEDADVPVSARYPPPSAVLNIFTPGAASLM